MMFYLVTDSMILTHRGRTSERVVACKSFDSPEAAKRYAKMEDKLGDIRRVEAVRVVEGK